MHAFRATLKLTRLVGDTKDRRHRSRSSARHPPRTLAGGVAIFGVEAGSPAPQGEANFKGHVACAERGITHIECLWNLEAVVGGGALHVHRVSAAHQGRDGEPDPRAVAMFEP